MFPFVKHILNGQNQFASGGLLLMLIGSAGVFLRELPARLWALLVHETTLAITVKDDDAAFRWAKEWLLEQNFLKRVRQVDLDTTLRGAELALIPAPGTHWFWHQGRPFSVRFHRSEESRGRSQRRVESLTFQTIGRRQGILLRLVDEIVACHHIKQRMASSLYVYDDYWADVPAYAPRLLESIILKPKPGEKEHVLQDLERFRASRLRYRQLGVPYHRGYLLYGPPGTGKTSLVSALAAHFGMSIYAINLTDMNDRSLKAAISQVQENSVILFEDIDAMRAGHRRSGRSTAPDMLPPSGDAAPAGLDADPAGTHHPVSVTLSGLLNVLDGFHAPENVIFVMTTNDAGALDPALLRPGRIDYRLFLGHAEDMQKVELYSRFFPGTSASEAAGFAQAHAADTMAEFQGLLLRLEHQEERCLPV